MSLKKIKHGTHARLYIYIYVGVYVYVYMHACVYTYVRACVHVCVCVCAKYALKGRNREGMGGCTFSLPSRVCIYIYTSFWTLTRL